MKKILFYAVIAVICFASCNNDDIFIETNEVITDPIALLEEVYSADQEVEMLRPFARALYSAMSESPMLREIIKTKALEQFNKEYDVLYQFIKNEQVENGLTVRQLLLKHFENEEMLADIERRRPTLTIFVPQLPEETFSAEIWNTAEEIPAVALHVTKHIHTPIIGDFGEYGDEIVAEAGLIPAFPTVVLKNNVRVRVTEGSQHIRSAVLDNPNSDFVFEFTNDFFDGSKVKEPASTRRVLSHMFPTLISPTLIKAFETYQHVDGWHRDEIYYGITPTNPNGRVSRNYQEHLATFRFCDFRHKPADILSFLTDPNNDRDPQLIPLMLTVSHPWTTGRYTFRVIVEIGSISPTPTQREHTVLVRPEELFWVVHVRQGLFWRTRIDGFRTVELNIPLITWDLAEFEPSMKISIEKVNPSTTTTTTITNEREFAGNINMDFKFGLKFGTSGRHRRTVSTQIVTQSQNARLGNVFVHFGDNVLLNRIQGQNIWEFREHNSGMFAITVVPRRVQ